MRHDHLSLLLQGSWPDPDSGEAIGVPVRSVVIAPTLNGEEADLVATLGLGRSFAVVSDPTTREVLARRVEQALAGLGRVTPIVLDDRPHADAGTAAAIAEAAAGADALIAVGAGTINDLCKHAAAQAGKPYAVFATAPSMNGYTSMNAAITVEGHKKSLPARPPAGVFMDLAILAAAPVRMIRAGLGDSLCRTTAQADWLMSHHVRGTGYRRAPFVLLEADEPVLIERAEALVAGDREAMAHLASTLVLSGLGMTICGGSYPASQGEHLISHYLDTLAPPRRFDALHGEQVGVATLTMARIQEHLLAGDPPRLRPSRASRQDLIECFGETIGTECWAEFDAKRLDLSAAEELNHRLGMIWDDLRRDIAAIQVPLATIEKALRTAGAPVQPEEIGVARDHYRTAVLAARYLRNRYTFLDLADDAGRLAEAAGG